MYLIQACHKEDVAVPLEGYLVKFVHLLVVPFDNLGRAWPILPIYTALILGEIYRSKVSFPHAVGNGFVMVWAGATWARDLTRASALAYVFSNKALAWVVAGAAIALGVFAIVIGLRKKDKTMAEILGHTRFSCYFIIAFYPMQAGLVAWSWSNMAAILIFAIPCWILIWLLGRLASKWVG